MQITGMHYCLPPYRLTNEELATEFGRDSVQRVSDVTGIYERRIGQSNLELGYHAARHLLESLNVDVATVEYLIYVSESFDYSIPTNAAIMHEKLGFHKDAMAFDISMGCSGWPYALRVMESLLEPDAQGLIINADTITRFLDPGHRGLRCLHGDGACATFVIGSEAYRFGQVMDIRLGTNGSGAKYINLPNTQDWRFVHMDGAAVSHFVLSTIPNEIREALDDMGLSTEDLGLSILHQANRQIVDAVYDELELPQNKRFHFLSHVGNLSNASTPVALSQAWRQELLEKKLVAVTAFGAGFSWGTVLIQFDEAKAIQGPTELQALKHLYRTENMQWTL